MFAQPLRIYADGVEILARPHDYSSAKGLFVGPDGFTGWEDGGGEVHREAVQRPGGVGEFDMPVYEGGMVFSVDGKALANSPYTLAHLRDQVMGIGRGGRRFKVSVELQGRTLWTWARRGVRPMFKDSGIRSDLLQASFLLQFVAPVPRKYGEVFEFPSGQVAFHRGNENAVPRLLIGAGSGGYTVTGPDGRRIVVSTAPSGAHYIDFENGGLFTAAGVRQGGAITVYQPWSIPPGLPGVIATISGSRSLITQVTETFN